MSMHTHTRLCGSPGCCSRCYLLCFVLVTHSHRWHRCACQASCICDRCCFKAIALTQGRSRGNACACACAYCPASTQKTCEWRATTCSCTTLCPRHDAWNPHAFKTGQQRRTGASISGALIRAVSISSSIAAKASLFGASTVRSALVSINASVAPAACTPQYALTDSSSDR